MQYQDLVITIAAPQGPAFPVSFVADGIGRVSASLPRPGSALKQMLARLENAEGRNAPQAAEAAGVALFRWLASGPLEEHLRLVWDRAKQTGSGLRLRLSIDPPELGAWPWELLRDPTRGHTFATSINTPLVRYLDQTAQFGSLVSQEAELPLSALVVLPSAPDLNLQRERSDIEGAAALLGSELELTVLDGIVTRPMLAEALRRRDYDILHLSGHGGFSDGQGFVALNEPDGRNDWVDGLSFSRLLGNHRSIKLAVLNVCAAGKLDDGRAFRGLAPQLVRYGIPAVVAMQYPVPDDAAATFAREFYGRLCSGEDAGQVDLAVAYARSMLGVFHPHELGWAAPVLFTHAADGVIYNLPRIDSRRAGNDHEEPRLRLGALIGSLQNSMALDEEWALADAAQLKEWRQGLRRALDSYAAQEKQGQAEVRQAAKLGLTHAKARLAALERALAKTGD